MNLRRCNFRSLDRFISYQIGFVTAQPGNFGYFCCEGYDGL